MTSIVFRCRSMTTEDHHHILVPDNGHITCSCQGESWCSHIEATLVCGERAMVPKEDWLKADQAQVLARGRIGPPPNWKSNWRSKRKWRGMATREPQAMILLKSGNPVVSMQGRGVLRKRSTRIALENGWHVVPAPTKGVIVHVSDEESGDPRQERAENLGILRLTHDQWPSVAPLGQTLRARMSDLLKECVSS